MERNLCAIAVLLLAVYCQGLDLTRNRKPLDDVGSGNKGAVLTRATLVQHPGNMSPEMFTSLLQLIAQSVDRLEDKIEQMKKEVDEKSDSIVTRLDSFQRRQDDKLNLFENRVEDKIDNNNNLNKLIQLDSKVSTELAQFRSEAKSELLDTLETTTQRLQAEQKDILKNVSRLFESTLGNVSDLLSSMERHLDSAKSYGQMNWRTVRNETETIREMLTSGEVSAQCLRDDTTSSYTESLPVQCNRHMNDAANTTYPKYMKTPQFTLRREVLCDTHTDGGGWTVIQRRVKGDVFFYRDWASYKKGFGTLDGDFWLGNEAIHILTYVQPYELRVDIRSEDQDYFAHYNSFKLESESDKYRIRLGSVTGSLNESGSGLSYSNNMFFSTFDRDNDKSSGSCAQNYQSGWWFNNCEYSMLNGPWSDKQVKEAWYNGKKHLHATLTYMKIRPLK